MLAVENIRKAARIHMLNSVPHMRVTKRRQVTNLKSLIVLAFAWLRYATIRLFSSSVALTSRSFALAHCVNAVSRNTNNTHVFPSNKIYCLIQSFVYTFFSSFVFQFLYRTENPVRRHGAKLKLNNGRPATGGQNKYGFVLHVSGGRLTGVMQSTQRQVENYINFSVGLFDIYL